MWNLKRTIVVGTSCAIAAAAPSVAYAATSKRAASINTTQRITMLYTTAKGVTNVGTSDGSVARATVHGALRAVAKNTTPTTFTAKGTLFYRTGTLRYTLHGTAAAHSDGSLTFTGSGTFTGGTGQYAGARGRFTVTGTRPANSFETWRLSGKVSR